MSTVKKIFALTLYTAGEDLSKRWFVRIKVPDYRTGKFSWKKCYGDVNKGNSVAERTHALQALAQHIEETQQYELMPGSRKIASERAGRGVTHLIAVFKSQLSNRTHTLRISSRRKYDGLIKNMETWLVKQGKKDLHVGSFTRDHAKAFLQWLKDEEHHSNESHNQHLRLFKSFFAELMMQGIVAVNPFLGIRGMLKQHVPALYFSKEQIGILKSVLVVQDPQLWLFVNFIYYGFIRPGELRNLLISDINFHEGRIRMRPEISKNKKLQYVSVPGQLMALLKEHNLHTRPKHFYIFGRDHQPGEVRIGVNTMKVRHQAICKRLSLSTDHKLYSWKHTGAIACARAGMPLKDLQMQLRHHSLDQVNRYLTNMLVWESDFIKNSYPSI